VKLLWLISSFQTGRKLFEMRLWEEISDWSRDWPTPPGRWATNRES